MWQLMIAVGILGMSLAPLTDSISETQAAPPIVFSVLVVCAVLLAAIAAIGTVRPSLVGDYLSVVGGGVQAVLLGWLWSLRVNIGVAAVLALLIGIVSVVLPLKAAVGMRRPDLAQ